MKEVFKADTIGELNSKIESFIDNHEVYECGNVTIIIEFVEDETDGGYHWEATFIPKYTASALKEVLVEEHGYVNVFWHEDDILGRVGELYDDEEIPCETLTQGQLDSIRQELASTHDAEMGLSWETIDCAIRDVFDEEMLGEDGYENDWTSTEMIGM